MTPPYPWRFTSKQTITTVVHVVQRFGRERHDPPSLGHLREFVKACDGLPDDTPVTLEWMSEGFTFSLQHKVRDTPDPEAPA